MSIAIGDETELLETSKERLPDFYEVVNGEIVEVAPMSDYANRVANRLNNTVAVYLHSNDIGETGVENLFRIPAPGDLSRNRRPDWAFVSYDRWPRERPKPYTGNAADVVPDIIAEVVSPSDFADDLIAKATEYLTGGVRLVWIFYPLTQQIHEYRPGARQIRVYFVADQLEAPEILPGFRTAIASLFPPMDQTSRSGDRDV